VPHGHYPCCIAGNNDGPPDGVGGISRHNEVVKAFGNPEAITLALTSALAALAGKGARTRTLDPQADPS
jgi:hypothetical protein